MTFNSLHFQVSCVCILTLLLPVMEGFKNKNIMITVVMLLSYPFNLLEVLTLFLVTIHLVSRAAGTAIDKQCLQASISHESGHQ